MNVTLIQTVWTVIAFVFFVGIVVWAWRGDRKEDFDKAARMALDDDKPIDSNDSK